MYRLLIVDDEPIIADGLYDTFKNLTHIELDVYKAYSGNDAIEWLNRTKIDIVMTDIHMPGISGLQLLEVIHKNWPECRVIFLTGYNEFDYVYTAIQYERASYLLKTEGYKKIIGAVEKAILDIEKSLKVEKLINNANEEMSVTTDLLRKQYLSDILRGDDSCLQASQQDLNRFGVPLKADKPVLLLVGRIDCIPEKTSYQERLQYFYAIDHISEKYLSPCVQSVFNTDDRKNMIWFMQPKACGEEEAGEENYKISCKRAALFIKGTLETIQASCKESLHISVSFVFDGGICTWDSIGEKYYALRQLLDCRIGNGMEMLITDTVSSTDEGSEYIEQDDSIRQVLLKLNKVELLETYLERGQKEEFYSLLHQFTGCLSKVKSINNNQAMQIYYTISLMFLSYINRYNLSEKIAFKIGLYKLMRIDEHDTWENAARYFEELASTLLELEDDEQIKRTQDAIACVQEYICDHLYEDLSLVRLAETVHFNPSYLSRLFKQATESNLSEYITNTRIKKAKELLSDSSFKIHEIAEAVGYGSSTNFGRLFKKITGLSPQEYRELCEKSKNMK